MENQQKLSTEEILSELECGNAVDADAIDFTADVKEYLNSLARDITECYGSHSRFAATVGLSQAHLNEYLNGKKGMSRDKLICICITLKYDIKKTRTMLRCLKETDLYAKNLRDFEILGCIRQGKSLDETNEHLQQNGLNILA